MQSIKSLSKVILTQRYNVVEMTKLGPVAAQVRGKKKKNQPTKSPHKVRKPKETNIPVACFNPSFEDPLSGSAGFPEDMEMERNQEFSDDIASLTTRGFLRFQKQYDPPAEAVTKFIDLVKSVNPKLGAMPDATLLAMPLNNSELKYAILSKAAKEFDHSVPNSMLSAVRTIGAAANFYNTPISTVTPFDALTRIPDLPPNLYIQKEPVRFTEETKHYFGGISAFPKESTVITGLRAKQKYLGYKAKKQWP